MSGHSAQHPDRELSIREAGQLLHRTKEPTNLQLRWVEERLRHGSLKGRKSASGCWTTTATCVAEYMASQAYLQLLGKGHGRGKDQPSAGSGSSGEQAGLRKEYTSLRGIYEEVLKEYFLALIMRSRAKHRSRAYSGAVLAGQVAILLVVGCLLASSLRSLFPAIPPERAAVQRWLAEHQQDFSVTQWHRVVPGADGKSCSIRVQYTYTTPERKTIMTDRVFTMRDGAVVSYSSSP